MATSTRFAAVLVLLLLAATAVRATTEDVAAESSTKYGISFLHWSPCGLYSDLNTSAHHDLSAKVLRESMTMRTSLSATLQKADGSSGVTTSRSHRNMQHRRKIQTLEPAEYAAVTQMLIAVRLDAFTESIYYFFATCSPS